MAAHSEQLVNLGGGKYAIATYPVDDGGNYVPGGSAASGSATLANVNASASSVTLLESNTDRLTASVFNDSGADLYLKYGTSASTTSYTYFVPSNSSWDMPYRYTGIITGVWSSATGAARVTELEA